MWPPSCDLSWFDLTRTSRPVLSRNCCADAEAAEEQRRREREALEVQLAEQDSAEGLGI